MFERVFGFFKKANAQDQGPLSDLSAVSQWMTKLPIGDVHAAQEQVVQRLIEFNHAKLPKSKDRLAVLMYLDEQTRDMQHALCDQYLRNPLMSKEVESRLWTSIHAFYREVAQGYCAFLMDFASNPGDSPIRDMVPLITARAIRGFADLFKWHYFRYEKVDASLWLQQHNLYCTAERGGFQRDKVKVYASDSEVSSCEAEYLQALLLSLLSSGNLTPRQLDRVDRWLDNWSHLLSLERTYDPHRPPFYVDTSSGMGLLRTHGKRKPTYRYVATEALLDRIDAIKRALKTGTKPALLGLGEGACLPEDYDLLDRVAAEWSGNHHNRRRAPRHPENSHWEVVCELYNIHRRIQADAALAKPHGTQDGLTPGEGQEINPHGFVTAQSLDQRTPSDRQPDACERWPLEDLSEHGAGILMRVDDNRLKPGKLVALRRDASDDWRLGVVRRITRLDQEWCKVGVEFIGQGPRPATLEPDLMSIMSYSLRDNGPLPGPQASAALLLPHGEGSLLLLERSKYTHGQTYDLKSEGKTLHIRLDSAHKRGDGWLLAAYTVLRELR